VSRSATPGAEQYVRHAHQPLRAGLPSRRARQL